MWGTWGAGAVVGGGAVPVVALGRGARGTGGFLSGPAAVEEAGTAGLGAGRARLVGPEGLVAVELRARLGLAESTGGEEERRGKEEKNGGGEEERSGREEKKTGEEERKGGEEERRCCLSPGDGSKLKPGSEFLK